MTICWPMAASTSLMTRAPKAALRANSRATTNPWVSLSASNPRREFQLITPAVASTATTSNRVTISSVCVLIVTSFSFAVYSRRALHAFMRRGFVKRPAASHRKNYPESFSVLANQKTGESDDGLFIGEKCIFGRPLAGKFHQLAIVANVYIEIEFV